MEFEEIKREFQQLDEAFEALPKTEKQHLIRVSEYTKAIFLMCCNADIYYDDTKASARLKPEMEDAAIEGARLIGIGKVLVPELYHRMREDFTQEEVALYRKHAADGAKLLEPLLINKGVTDLKTRNAILECVSSHHENYDGKGFPLGLSGTNIPILGRIVNIANTFDRLSSEKLSEKPFEYALNELISGAGVQFDPILVDVVVDNKAKLKRAFGRYINQTRAIPQTECIVRRHGKRPFALFYRPIINYKTKATIAVEAKPMFKEAKDWLEYSEVENIIKTQGIQKEIDLYFIQELCDTAKRLDACTINSEFIMYSPHAAFFNNRGLINELTKIIKDVDVDAGKIAIAVNKEMYDKKTKTMEDNLKKLTSLGIKIIFDGFGINEISAQELIGAYGLRLAPDIGPRLEEKETTEYLVNVDSQGINIFARDIEKKSHFALFSRNRIKGFTGDLSGEYVQEDDFIESELALLN